MMERLKNSIGEFIKKAAASRKFWLCVSAMTASSALLGVGLLNADQWMSFNTGIVALYVGGNVSASFIKSKYFVPEMHVRKQKKK